MAEFRQTLVTDGTIYEEKVRDIKPITQTFSRSGVIFDKIMRERPAALPIYTEISGAIRYRGYVAGLKDQELTESDLQRLEIGKKRTSDDLSEAKRRK